MIRHMFLFGVIIPTAITIFIFLSFLICWFKFNIRDRLFSKHLKKKKQLKESVAGQPVTVTKPVVTFCRHVDEDGGDNNKEDKGMGGGGGRSPEQQPPSLPASPATLRGNPPQGFEFADDTYSIEDQEAALCSHVVTNEQSDFFSNPSMGLCEVDTKNRVTDETLTTGQPNTLMMGHHVAQTFHFPPPTQCGAGHKRVSIDSGSEDEGMNDDGNYGHFVHVEDLDGLQVMDLPEDEERTIKALQHQAAMTGQSCGSQAQCPVTVLQELMDKHQADIPLHCDTTYSQHDLQNHMSSGLLTNV